MIILKIEMLKLTWAIEISEHCKVYEKKTDNWHHHAA